MATGLIIPRHLGMTNKRFRNVKSFTVNPQKTTHWAWSMKFLNFLDRSMAFWICWIFKTSFWINPGMHLWWMGHDQTSVPRGCKSAIADKKSVPQVVSSSVHRELSDSPLAISLSRTHHQSLARSRTPGWGPPVLLWKCHPLLSSPFGPSLSQVSSATYQSFQLRLVDGIE